MIDQQRLIDKMSEFKDLIETLKQSKLQFEAKIAKLRQNKDKFIEIKTQLTKKIKKEIDLALAQMLNKEQIVEQNPQKIVLNKEQIVDQIPQQIVPIKQFKFVTRRTDDLVPTNKEAQN